MKHYCFVLLPEYSNLCLFNSLEPLRAANSFIQGSGYRWTLVSIDGQPATSPSGFDIQPHCSLDQLLDEDKPDALFVLASYNYQRHTTPQVIARLRQARQQVGLIGGATQASAAGLANCALRAPASHT
ncbi:hypothetical protein GCM10009104_21570 [Marinobacterium maritimum]|uniref:AraC family transcriptional regulator n=1 Tax=Marinobacterium maritimum TaxID=500162 RepID=A0ABP3TEB4_9GAMM